METAMSDNKNLVLRSQQHLIKQVETANIRLSISSQLAQDVERRRFLEILKGIDKEKAVKFLSKYSFLNEELIDRFESEWDWKRLSRNETLPWSISGIGGGYQMKPCLGL